MLALASTISLACAQSPKSLSDAQVDSKHNGQLPKRGLQMPRMMNKTRALPGEKYGATQPDIKIFFLFLFLFLFEAATVAQLARRVQPKRTQVVCSNKVGQSRLAQDVVPPSSILPSTFVFSTWSAKCS